VGRRARSGSGGGGEVARGEPLDGLWVEKETGDVALLVKKRPHLSPNKEKMDFFFFFGLQWKREKERESS